MTALQLPQNNQQQVAWVLGISMIAGALVAVKWAVDDLGVIERLKSKIRRLPPKLPDWRQDAIVPWVVDAPVVDGAFAVLKVAVKPRIGRTVCLRSLSFKAQCGDFEPTFSWSGRIELKEHEWTVLDLSADAAFWIPGKLKTRFLPDCWTAEGCSFNFGCFYGMTDQDPLGHPDKYLDSALGKAEA